MALAHVVVGRRMLDVGGGLGARTVEGHRGLWRRGKVPTRRSWCSCKCGTGDRGSRGWSLLRERVVAVMEWRVAGRVNSRRGRMGSQRNVRRSEERGSRTGRGRRAGEGYKGGRACPAHEAERKECVEEEWGMGGSEGRSRVGSRSARAVFESCRRGCCWLALLLLNVALCERRRSMLTGTRDETETGRRFGSSVGPAA